VSGNRHPYRDHLAQDVFQTFQPGALAGQRNLLDDILAYELCSRVHPTVIDHFFDETLYNRWIVLHQLMSPLF
jgi:hypothetical protein